MLLNTRMLTFAQFLTERFLKGLKDYGYAEIWKDPSYLEALKLAYAANRANDESAINRMGTGTKNIDLGGWILDDHLYLWDRGQATHMPVRHNLPYAKTPETACAIYLRVNPSTKEAIVRLAEYSHPEDTKYDTNQKLVNYCRKLKAFKSFGRVVTDNESDSY